MQPNTRHQRNERADIDPGENWKLLAVSPDPLAGATENPAARLRNCRFLTAD
jgi:hypothetical protein